MQTRVHGYEYDVKIFFSVVISLRLNKRWEYTMLSAQCCFSLTLFPSSFFSLTFLIGNIVSVCPFKSAASVFSFFTEVFLSDFFVCHIGHVTNNKQWHLAEWLMRHLPAFFRITVIRSNLNEKFHFHHFSFNFVDIHIIFIFRMHFQLDRVFFAGLIQFLLIINVSFQYLTK